MTEVIYIYGHPDKGESLRAECREDVVVLISHEFRGGTQTDLQWRDRVLATIEWSKWFEIAGSAPDNGAATLESIYDDMDDDVHPTLVWNEIRQGWDDGWIDPNTSDIYPVDEAS